MRVGIVGCGNIADNHFRPFRAARRRGRRVADVEPAGPPFADARHPRRGRVGRRPARARRTAVTVCTPHPTHERGDRRRSRRGPRAVREAARRRRRRRSADGRRRRDSHVILGPSFQRRYWPAAQSIRAAIDDGCSAPRCSDTARSCCTAARTTTTADWRGTWARRRRRSADDPGHPLHRPAAVVHGRAGRGQRRAAFVPRDGSRSRTPRRPSHVRLRRDRDPLRPSPLTPTSAPASASPEAAAARSASPNTRKGPRRSTTCGRCPEAASHVGFASGSGRPTSPSPTSTQPAAAARLQLADFVDAVRTGRLPAVTGRDAADPWRSSPALRLREVRAPGAGGDPGDDGTDTPIGRSPT